jgi:hypothetical protein
METEFLRLIYDFTCTSPPMHLCPSMKMSLAKPLILSKHDTSVGYRDSKHAAPVSYMKFPFVSSAMIEEEDLEDGEIESDGETEDCVVVEVKPPPEIPKAPEKSSSPSKKKSPSDSHSKSSKSSGSSSRKEKGNQDEDDFMSKIENALAENLKKSGIEPPMPSVKKHVEPEQEERKTRRNRNRKSKKRERKDQKRDSGSSRVGFGDFPPSISLIDVTHSFSQSDRKSAKMMVSTWSAEVPLIPAANPKETPHTAATTPTNTTG